MWQLFWSNTIWYILLGVSTVIEIIILFSLSITCTTIYFLKLKCIWKSIVILLLFVGIYFASKLNLIHIKDGWFLAFPATNILGMYCYALILDKLMRNNIK